MRQAFARLIEEPARPKVIANWRYAPWLAVLAVCFGAFMGQLDASIVTVVFPAIGGEFGVPLPAVQWVSLAYLLVLVALLAVVGRLADTFGRKQFYLYGFVLFTAASAACGLAHDLPALIGFRAVQALGAAMLQANSVALVTTSVGQRLARTALGVQAAAQALGLALGPALGGVLVGGLGWRWVFWVNVPIGAIALLAGRYLLPRTRQRSPWRGFDWLGASLLALGAGAVLLGVSLLAGPARWPAIGVLVVGCALLVGFAGWQPRAACPLLDPALLRSSTVGLGLLGALIGYLVLFGPLVLVPVVLGGSPATAGVVLTVLPAGFALGASAGSRLLPGGWTNRRRAIAGGLTSVAALVGLLALPSGLASLVPMLALLGVGLGVYTPANNATVMAAIGTRAAAVGGGMVNTARALGTAFGIATVTLALHLSHGAAHGDVRPAALPLAVFAAVLVAISLPRNDNRNSSRV